MKNFNQMISTCLASLLVLSCCFIPVSATTQGVLFNANNQHSLISESGFQEDVYDELCNELVILYAKLEIAQKESSLIHTGQTDVLEIQNQIDALNSRLDMLGTRILSTEEFVELALASGAHTRGAIDVEDSAYATIRASNLLSTVSGGKTYKYCVVTAMPTSEHSNLSNDSLLYVAAGSSKYSDFINNICSVYVNKLAGSILGAASWVPYELLTATTPGVISKVGTYTIDAKVRTTAKYYFVVESGKESLLDSSQYLLYETCNVYAHHVIFDNSTNSFLPARDTTTTYNAPLDAGKTVLATAISNYTSATTPTLAQLQKRVDPFTITAKSEAGSVAYSRTIQPASAPAWIGNIS